ncbi:RNA methyltransferase, TrmH family, group 3 [Pneumocystis murina B123]|uniref:rRNA methyltransferase 1, mitochondrial n=1 Tax=Pneumocystis murina (strain B123) TaxID=1069680 RepID=M7P716_PNEMU|nr:RNA methyltransferase, TrmH family, group 3 [Pneumocystis murina B123]EMR09680.1 RNA methyltransferase, TrmH family, group 3 [Pneumocystis murina B123]
MNIRYGFRTIRNSFKTKKKTYFDIKKIYLNKNLIYEYSSNKKYSINQLITGSIREKHRKDEKKVPKEYIYGRSPVFSALIAKNREKFYKLYIYGDDKKNDDILKISTSMSIPIEFVKSKSILDNYSLNRPHNGFVLETSPIRCISLTTRKELLDFQINYSNDIESKISNNLYSKNDLNLWLFLDEITDPMNMGAILRNAYYFGLNGVVLSEKNSASLSPIVNKASSGACEFLKIFKTANPLSFLQLLKSNNWKVIGTTSLSDKVKNDLVIPYNELDTYLSNSPVLLIMGNEHRGMRTLVKNKCDFLVTIPPSQFTFSLIDSLNVSVASGILISELSKILRIKKYDKIL